MTKNNKGKLNFKYNDRKLEITVFNENIVRFDYSRNEKKNITDAVTLDPIEVKFKKEDNKIKLPKFSIEVLEDLRVKIIDLKGNVILEDEFIQFDSKPQDSVFQEHEYEIINREQGKVYSVEIEKKHSWEKGFYGLGEKYGFINLLGIQTENWNTDVLGVSPVHTPVQKQYHTSIPFYIGMDEKKAYGIFYDTSYRNYFDFGMYQKGINFRTDGGELDYYYIHGDNISEVVEEYGNLTGKVKLPRKDFLGFQQCRWSYMNKKEVIDLAKSFREKDIPCDVIYLDIDYMEDYKVFTINSERFNEFKEMNAELKKMGFKLVVIVDPGVKVEEGYHVYEQALENDYLIKDENGEVYVGKVWPGDSAFPDFLRKSVRNWWGEIHKGLIDDGVSGIWNDMNEIADMSTDTKTIPESTYQIDDSGNKYLQKETHNLYGHYQGKATYNGLKNIQGTRPFVLTRSASAGTQRYSALWTGDNTSLWEHMESSIPMLMNLGLSGYTYVGSDVGGFIGDSNGELLTRWTQLGVFYPLFRNHSCVNSLYQEPWAFGEDVENIVSKYIKMRYSLVNHLYNLFRESSLTGAPIMRPLFYHYQQDENTFDINDEFLFGEEILVAPILRPRTYKRMVYLPEGKWYDYFTDEVYEGRKHIIKDAAIDKIPVFAKEGAIILKDKPMNYIGEKEENYEIHVYLGEDNSKDFYFDDGKSFRYENGEYSVINVEVKGEELEVKLIKGGYKLGKFDLVIHSANGIKELKNVEIK
ncbi:glycoside hydrolase family 31 protein [Clostridium sediminicola]|uniref:glycoside hydrolase family 31 protein n=1 Tax=Clostridium sediminicola TaxID=3114879 RepID=UPI0031F220EB